MVGENLGKSPLKTLPQVGRTRPKEASPETDCSTGKWRAREPLDITGNWGRNSRRLFSVSGSGCSLASSLPPSLLPFAPELRLKEPFIAFFESVAAAAAPTPHWRRK